VTAEFIAAQPLHKAEGHHGRATPSLAAQRHHKALSLIRKVEPSFSLETLMTYKAPLKDMLFAIEHVANIAEVAKIPGFEEAGLDTAQAVLEEAAKLNEGVIAPLNWEGDKAPSFLKDGKVTTSAGFADAFKQYAEGGWQGLQHPTDFGGQSLPKTIGAACIEMTNAANMSFALCPLLTDGAIEALLTAGSDELKATYLENLVTGKWTGTMNLTEPQAGSDLALVRTRAEPLPDGSYKVFGTKIYITYGEHDMAENIVHLVLARVAGAPEGVKGISLFVVPKFMVGKDGSLGARNDVHCVSIEHKMGIKASPTAVLQYGDHGGAIGYLVGEENRGLEYMFIMMNAARYAVGVQGIAISDRAYQKAVQYAKDRVQSRPVDGSMAKSAPIIHHPDVKRMLMTMRATTEACRALAAGAAAAFDAAHHHPDAEVRKQNQAFYEFMVPLVKGYSTEMSLEVTSLGVQVHGGMGFIEETGAAQYYRDAKILTIYEGTTAIQANDLVGRKTSRDGGQSAKAIVANIERTEAELAKRSSVAARAVLKRLSAGRKALIDVIDYIAANTKANPNAAFAGSVPYLMLAGNVFAGWQMARSLMAAEDQLAAGVDADFMKAKITTARFYADHILARAPGVRDSIVEGADSVTELALEAF
jgi:3-(methylthio)propanoyl-CoA dehydrogenase